MLNEFVTQYNKAVRARRQAEEKEDFLMMNTLATLSGTHPVERVAEERYNRRIFNKFQAEFHACMRP